MQTTDWAVIGAGPAGITAVGCLLDRGVDPAQIAWFDREFTVGDFAGKWSHVPSNTQVCTFTRFLQACAAFRMDECSLPFPLLSMDPKQTCLLKNMALPLQWVSDHLRARVQAVSAQVDRLNCQQRSWQLQGPEVTHTARSVVLAIGSEPRILTQQGPPRLELVDVLDPTRLAECCDENDVVAVFGASHSAILVIRNLYERGVSRIVNIYKHPLQYAVVYPDHILNDDSGLKGSTAQWAREHLHGNYPPNIERYALEEIELDTLLKTCSRQVQAVGFQARASVQVEGVSCLRHDPYTGIIAPGLFGLGIAFPQRHTDRYGQTADRVGLWKFMEHAQAIVPVWQDYGL